MADAHGGAKRVNNAGVEGTSMAKRTVDDPIFDCLLALERAAKKATADDREKRRLMAAAAWSHIRRQLRVDPNFEDWFNQKLAADGWKLVRAPERT